MDIIQLTKTFLNDQVIEKISTTLGEDHDTTQETTEDVLDLLLGALRKNSASSDGAEELNRALTQDHDGGLLDSLNDYLQWEKPNNVSDNAVNAIGILKHVLGDKQNAAVELISQKTGVDKEKVTELLVKLAPIAMSLLGKVKKVTGSDASGVASLLTQAAKQQEEKGWFMWIVWKFLDKDGDGRYMDDLLEMAARRMTK